jgi:hypothetical protein
MQCVVCGRWPAEHQRFPRPHWSGVTLTFGLQYKEDAPERSDLEALQREVTSCFEPVLQIMWFAEETESRPGEAGLNRHYVVFDPQHPENLPMTPYPVDVELRFCGFACLRRWLTRMVDKLEETVKEHDPHDRECIVVLKNPAMDP